jgi:hypothetical protein
VISVKCKPGKVPEDRVFTKYAEVVVLNITAHLFFIFIKNVNGLYLCLFMATWNMKNFNA